MTLDGSRSGGPEPTGPAGSGAAAAARARNIDHLAVAGFLDNAAPYDMAEPQYKGPTVILRAHWGKGFYDEDLGWNLKMLNRLDGLRRVLYGDAGKAMDRFLAQLQAQRREWETASPAASKDRTSSRNPPPREARARFPRAKV